MVKLKDILDKIWGRLNAIDDYVIAEEHTDRGWSYRKWSNGVMEYWLKWYGTLSPYTHNALPPNAKEGYTDYWTFPEALVNDEYIKVASAQVSNGYGIVMTGGLNDSRNGVALHWASNTTGLSRVNIYIKGRWK